MENLNWSFFQIWNESLENKEEHEMKERQKFWASELGSSPIDLWLKVRAIKPTNPPDARAKRKFEAGNIWEWIVGLVLQRAGILISRQEWLTYQYPGMWPVDGKLDFLAGGKPDWDKAQKEISDLGLPEFIDRASKAIITYLRIKYPDGMEKIVLENKSCSSFMFEKYLSTGVCSPNHEMQTFFYLKALGLSEGHVVYVSKDDGRMLELGVLNPSAAEDRFKATIQRLTDLCSSSERPELEPQVIFDADWGRFSENWKVKYSNYLTMLYGFENQSSYENRWKKTVTSWNRTLGRCVRGDKMTHLNLATIAEINKMFPNFDEVVEKVKAAGVNPDEGAEE
jgi:hypothetical protein